jgi:hypothetical protein
MRFQAGQSGNPAGGKRGPRKRQSAIRKMIADQTPGIVKAILADALAGDVAARQMFCRFFYPRFRFTSAPVDLPVAQSLAEAQEQIAMLVSMAARGDLDLDSAKILTDGLASSIDTALEEVDEFLEDKGREHVA